MRVRVSLVAPFWLVAIALVPACSERDDAQGVPDPMDVGSQQDGAEGGPDPMDVGSHRDDAGDASDLMDVGSHQDDAGDASDPIDFTVELPGTYSGTEQSASIGTLRSTYAVSWDAEAMRFEVAAAGMPVGTKFVFSAVEVAAPGDDIGYVTLPDQVYAEGQTGQVTLQLSGSGTFTPEAPLGPWDGRVDLEEGRIEFEGIISVFGNEEAFTFVLQAE